MSEYGRILDAVSVSLALIVPPAELDRVIAEYPPGSEGYPQPEVLEVLARSRFTFINAFGAPATGAPDVDYIRDIFNTWLITTSRYAEGIHRALAASVSGEVVRTTANVGGIDGRFRDWDWEFTYFRTKADEPRFLITGRNITKRVSLVRSRTEYERQLEILLAERRAELAESRHSFDVTSKLVLSIVAMRNDPTATHMRQVADFAGRVAEQLGLDEQTSSELRAAALVHDVGMLSVPSELLTKMTPLSTIEEMVLREHVRTGTELLRKSGFEDAIVDAVLQHHERWDGSGYPAGLAGEQIGLAARILAVADTVAELSRERVGRRKMSHGALTTHLKNEAGAAYDPEVVKAAVKVLQSGGVT